MLNNATEKITIDLVLKTSSFLLFFISLGFGLFCFFFVILNHNQLRDGTELSGLSRLL